LAAVGLASILLRISLRSTEAAFPGAAAGQVVCAALLI
jgi:hypothetical protein